MILGLGAMAAATAAAGGVSTFAWFASNYTVSATGMTIKASSNNVYLQIKDSADNWSTTNDHLSATAKTGLATVSPTHVFKALTVNTGDTADETTVYDGGTTYQWASASSDKVTDATRVGHYTNVTSVADPSGTASAATTYTLINTFNLRLRPNLDSTGTASSTQPKAKDLVASVEWANTMDFTKNPIAYAVSVLVFSGEAGELFTVNADGKFAMTTETNGKKLAASMEGNKTDVTCKVYVFLDGENANCKSENVLLDSEYSVNVNFTVVDDNKA